MFSRGVLLVVTLILLHVGFYYGEHQWVHFELACLVFAIYFILLAVQHRMLEETIAMCRGLIQEMKDGEQQ